MRIICSPVTFADFHSEIISLDHMLVMTCSVYLHSLGSVAQNSYRGKHRWMGDIGSQVFKAFCSVMHHSKQMIFGTSMVLVIHCSDLFAVVLSVLFI